MPTLQELRDQRAAAWAQAQEYNARGADAMTAEDESAWARALDDVDRLGEQIANRERTESLDRRFAEIDEDTVTVDRSGTPDPDGEYRAAFEQYVRHGMAELDVEQRQLLQANFRAQGEATGSIGGYTVPEGFWAKVTETMKAYGGAEAGAEVINSASGNPLPWPTNNDTSNVGELIGENSAHNEQDLTFGQKSLGNYTFSSKMVRVSLQLLQDSGIDVEAFVARKLGERLGRVENTYFTTGTGSSQPQGYVTGATTGKTTNSATAITYEEFIDLIHSVDAAYRASGRCRFKMHDLVLAYVRKIRDDSGGAGVGRPLWEPSIQAGVPDAFLGYPITVNNDMASSVATTLKTVAFGDFESAFVVRRVRGGSMIRMAERYAEYLQVAFLGWERADSLVQDSGAVKLMVQT